jgi:hypothetical protein
VIHQHYKLKLKLKHVCLTLKGTAENILSVVYEEYEAEECGGIWPLRLKLVKLLIFVSFIFRHTFYLLPVLIN